MTEEEARIWVEQHFGESRAKALDQFGEILRDESTRQNLISASSFDHLWTRHFVDSAQLIPHSVDAGEGNWVDVGTGAGMPGLVVALLIDRPIVLIEPRAKRADFLYRAAALLGVGGHVEVRHSRSENYAPETPAAVISARAVSELSQLFNSSHHFADSNTKWLLPKGRAAQSEVEAARRKWRGVFHVEPSLTQEESGIVIARGVMLR